MEKIKNCKHNNKLHEITRQFILFAAAIRQTASGESVSKKLGVTVTDTQADALRFLALNDKVTIGQISIGLGHTISGATKAVNRLEKQGWVIRENGGTDHRSVYVHLTDEGRELTKILLSEAELRIHKILRKLKPDTVDRLNGVIEIFLKDYIDDDLTATHLCIACGFEGGIDCRKTDTDCVVAQSLKQID